jgi:hypothetical protein
VVVWGWRTPNQEGRGLDSGWTSLLLLLLLRRRLLLLLQASQL